MVVGLGTGSTATSLLKKLAVGLQRRGYKLLFAVTPHAGEPCCVLGIPLKNIDEVEYVDLTVDGADEVDGAFMESKVAVQPY